MRVEDTPTHGTHSGKKSATCGCYAAHCCLSCPLAVCILEIPLATQRVLHRTQRMKELRAAGKSSDEIAGALGISKRSLYRRGMKGELCN